MKRVTVTVDGTAVFSRDCEFFSSEETIDGRFNVKAVFPSQENDVLRLTALNGPTGTVLSRDFIEETAC